jgi:hypothetical protein
VSVGSIPPWTHRGVRASGIPLAILFYGIDNWNQPFCELTTEMLAYRGHFQRAMRLEVWEAISAASLVLGFTLACSTPVTTLLDGQAASTSGAAGSTGSGAIASTGSAAGSSTSSSGTTTSSGGTSTGGASGSGTTSSLSGSRSSTGGFRSCELGDAGLFQSAIDIVTDVGPSYPDDSFHSIALGDLDGDGNLDLAIADYESGALGLAFGNGDGSFQPVVPIDAGTLISDLLVAGVGKPAVASLAVACVDLSGDAGILFIQVQRQRLPEIVAKLPSPDGQAGWIAAADLNRDGLIDFAAALSRTIGAFVANDAGGWSQSASVTGYAFTRDFIGEFNEDGIPDLVVGTPTSLQVFLGRGDGSFSDAGLKVSGTGTNLGHWLIGDLNEDGHLDLLWNDTVSVSVLLGYGDGTFTLGPAPGLSVSTSPWVLGDLNGDGHLDYVGAGNQDNSVHVALGNGDGTFQPEILLPLAPASSGAVIATVAIGDVNNDGRPDLLASTFRDGNVSLFINCQ